MPTYEAEWLEALVPDPALENLDPVELRGSAVDSAMWIEGGDPNYIVDLYQEAFELGRRAGKGLED